MDSDAKQLQKLHVQPECCLFQYFFQMQQANQGPH